MLVRPAGHLDDRARRRTHRAAAVVGAVGLALLGMAVQAPAAGATYSGRDGLIVFSADSGSGFQLFTVRPDGTHLRQVTHVVGDAVGADWSPDGRHIVFELDHPEGNPFCSVLVIRPDGSDAVDITGTRNGCEAQPSYTPDGRRIVFERFDDATNVDAIWSMRTNGADRRQITTGTAGATDPNVSPDGRTVSFVDFNGADFGQALATTRLDGTKARQLVPFTADVAIKQDWAPDGCHLAFTDNADFPVPGVSANIATVRPDGTGLHYLTHFTGGDDNAFMGSYSPDGRWIVFRLEHDGQYGLYRMRATGGGLEPILPLSSFKPRFIDWGSAT